MKYRINADGRVVTQGEIRKMFSNTSLPRVWTAEVCAGLGIEPILNGAQAAVSGPYEVSVEQGIEQINGQWFTKFVVGPVFTDTTEDGVTTTAAEHEAAYKAGIDAKAAESVRNERNTKLSASDWTQVADAPVDQAAWATYRQALRDITAQTGFPHNVTWPVAP